MSRRGRSCDDAGPPPHAVQLATRCSLVDAVLVAGVGALAVHEIAYLPGALGASVGAVDIAHAQSPALWAIGTLLGFLAVGRAVVVSLRTRAVAPRIDVGVLSVTIIAMYVAQELVERLAAGHSPASLLAEPALWLGVVSAPVVAVVFSRLVQGAADAVATLVAGCPMPSHLPARMVVARVGPHPPVVAVHSLSRRGPPRSDRHLT